MARRASKSSTIAPSTNRVQLKDVPLGHRARFLDGSIVLVAFRIGTATFVRDNDGVGHGPYELPRDTPVVEVIAPEVRYSADGAVKDPLA